MSGFIGLATGALGAAGGVSSALNNLASLLRPASWRGVPFGVTQYSISPGRQTAVHTYPFRDGQWVEDSAPSRLLFMGLQMVVRTSLQRSRVRPLNNSQSTPIRPLR